MKKPELSLERTDAQRKRDYAALEVAKRQEAERLKKGGKYVRIDNRTIILKEDVHQERI